MIIRPNIILPTYINTSDLINYVHMDNSLFVRSLDKPAMVLKSRFDQGTYHTVSGVMSMDKKHKSLCTGWSRVVMRD